MKTLRLLTITILSTSLLFLSSCEKVKDLADVKFDATIKTNVNVTSAPAGNKGDTFHFEGQGTLDPTADETINEYWGVIKEWSIKKVIVTVNHIDQESTLTNGSLYIIDVDNNDNILFETSVQSMTLKDGITVLEINEAEWDALVNALDNKHKIHATIAGDIDNPNVTIEFGIKVFVHVVANPL